MKVLAQIATLVLAALFATSGHSQRLSLTGANVIQPAPWQLPAISADGTKIYIPTFPDSILGSPPSFYYSSYDTGQTWTKQSGTPGPSKLWVSGCASSDGTIVYGADQGAVHGFIWKSTNSGVTWSQTNSPQLAWQQVSCSSDGTKLVGCVGSQAAEADLQTSIDGGATWVDQTGSLSRNWISCVISGDGTKIAATNWLGQGSNGDGKIYVSTNWQSGSPIWTGSNAAAGGSTFGTAAYSRDGSTIYEVFNTAAGHVFITTNDGGSWADINPAGSLHVSWTGVSCSANGKRVVAQNTVNQVSGLFISNNYGVSWTQINPIPIGPSASQNVFSAVSDNGLTIVSAVYAGYVSVSTDGGTTFRITNATP